MNEEYVYQEKKSYSVSIGVFVLSLLLCASISGIVGFFSGLMFNGNFKFAQKSVGEFNYESMITLATGNEEKGLSVEEVVEKTEASVVVITTETVTNDSWYGNYIQSGAGSGVIIGKDGYIVTCYHVVENANKINIILADGNEYKANYVGGDDKTDIALLKIEASGELPAAVFGISANLKKGQTAIVIGNPLGTLGGSVSSGIISALDRKIKIDDEEMVLLQTDAAVNPGNSGGALFDDSGCLVGIVNAKNVGNSVEGLGFAIPIDIVKTVLADLSEYGYVRGRATLNLSFLEIKDAMTAMRYGVSSYGVYITRDSGEFETGDRIVNFNSEAVESVSQLKSLISGCKVGDEVEVVVARQNKQIKITATILEYNPTENF